MITRSCRAIKWLVLALGIVCTVLAIVVLPAWVRAATLNLPPRPPTPTPRSTTQPAPEARRESEPAGAYISLHLQSTDRGFTARWPELWTAVQWQDAQGRWHDVEGWRGALDNIQGGVGRKTWWLADNLFGRGPFRWLVAQEEGGPSLAISEPFYLPQVAGETVQLKVLLTR
jgi:hypothetical protein